MPASYWFCSAFTIVSASVSFGFSIAGLRASSGTERTASLYAFARSLALIVIAVVAIVSDSIGFVAAAALAMVIVQAVDAVIGGLIHDPRKTFGPAAIAALGLATVIWLCV